MSAVPVLLFLLMANQAEMSHVPCLSSCSCGESSNRATTVKVRPRVMSSCRSTVQFTHVTNRSIPRILSVQVFFGDVCRMCFLLPRVEVVCRVVLGALNPQTLCDVGELILSRSSACFEVSTRWVVFSSVPLRLWDKLPQALQRSGGDCVLEETQEHNGVLPVHPGPQPEDQG